MDEDKRDLPASRVITEAFVTMDSTVLLERFVKAHEKIAYQLGRATDLVESIDKELAKRSETYSLENSMLELSDEDRRELRAMVEKIKEEAGDT